MLGNHRGYILMFHCSISSHLTNTTKVQLNKGIRRMISIVTQPVLNEFARLFFVLDRKCNKTMYGKKVLTIDIHEKSIGATYFYKHTIQR